MNDITKTIFRQMGGNRLCVMTGARCLADDANDRIIIMLRRRSKGINMVEVKLERDDTYSMSFTSRSISHREGPCLSVRQIALVQGVYAEDLQRIFTDKTGLYTRL